MTPIIQNADNTDLDPELDAIHIDHVNGMAAQEMPFLPTRHELIQLVQMWAREVEWCWQQTIAHQGATEELDVRQTFGWRRINRIATLIGPAAVRAAIEDVAASAPANASAFAWFHVLGEPDECGSDHFE